MLYVIWGILVIPVIAAGMTLHFKIKEWGKQKWNILPKCLSTWMIVCTGFLGIWARGDSQGLDKKWILAALLLFLLADGLLEIQFFLGDGSFWSGSSDIDRLVSYKRSLHSCKLFLVAAFYGNFPVYLSRGVRRGKRKPLAVCHDPIPGCTYGNDGSGDYAACKTGTGLSESRDRSPAVRGF